MSRHITLSPAEAADRLAIRELVDVASLRYLDTFVKTDGTWLFSERLLYVDWVDERALA